MQGISSYTVRIFDLSAHNPNQAIKSSEQEKFTNPPSEHDKIMDVLLKVTDEKLPIAEQTQKFMNSLDTVFNLRGTSFISVAKPGSEGRRLLKVALERLINHQEKLVSGNEDSTEFINKFHWISGLPSSLRQAPLISFMKQLKFLSPEIRTTVFMAMQKITNHFLSNTSGITRAQKIELVDCLLDQSVFLSPQDRNDIKESVESTIKNLTKQVANSQKKISALVKPN